MAVGEDIMVGKGTLRFELGYRDAISDQGVCISVYAAVDGEETELAAVRLLRAPAALPLRPP